MSFFVNTSFPQTNQGTEAERLILTYIEQRNLNIELYTNEFSALMKGILLGEHPELTSQSSSMATNELIRNQILSYAAEHMDGLGFQEDEISIVQSIEPFVEELKIENAQEQSTVGNIALGISDSRRKAIEYAYDWSIPGGTSRNPLYPDFGNDDCTNFVSQALNAGRFPMTGSGDGCKQETTNLEWYVFPNPSPAIWCLGDFRNWEWSTSWSVVWPFRDYLAHQHSYSIELGWTNDPDVAEYYLNPGDVIQLQYKDASGNWVDYHTMIVTFETINEVYVTYHSNAGGFDEVDKALSSIPTGTSQRYILVQILYPQLYIPVIINSDLATNAQETNPSNAYLIEESDPDEFFLQNPYPISTP